MGMMDRRGRKIAEGKGALFLLAAVAMSLLFLIPQGCGEETPPVMSTQADAGNEEYIEGLSADQSEILEELGYPDHFFISIDPYSSDRIEKWIYYSKGKAFDFDNGRVFGEEEVEDKSAEYPPTDLRPQDFQGLMTSEDVERLLGEPLYTHQGEDSLMPENTFVVYDKAVLLYRDGQLIGVDTEVRPPALPSQ